MNIYPSILTESFETLNDQLAISQANPDISIVEIDVIDGYFADAITITPIDLAVADWENVSINFHLMTQEPQDFVYETSGLKDQLPVNAVIGQVEQMSYQAEFLKEVKAHGWRAGLGLNLYTPIEAIDEDSWETLDIIELLSVEAGSQGQVFNPVIWAKIAEVQAKLGALDHPVELVVDGGVTLEMLEKLKQISVDSASVGSGIWENASPDQALMDYIQAAR